MFCGNRGVQDETLVLLGEKGGAGGEKVKRTLRTRLAPRRKPWADTARVSGCEEER